MSTDQNTATETNHAGTARNEALKPTLKIIQASDGPLADGLYSSVAGYYWYIEEGIFHFSLTGRNLMLARASGLPILEIQDLYADQWRYFIRASHYSQLFPDQAANIQTIVARLNTKL